jgi:PHP family Zn ribbon phosphoesterase
MDTTSFDNSQGTWLLNACDPICKRFARNDDACTLLDEVNKGECGPQMKKYLQDVITELGDLNEVAMKEQIAIQMTKTMHQDPPPTTLPRTVNY